MYLFCVLLLPRPFGLGPAKSVDLYVPYLFRMICSRIIRIRSASRHCSKKHFKKCVADPLVGLEMENLSLEQVTEHCQQRNQARST